MASPSFDLRNRMIAVGKSLLYLQCEGVCVQHVASVFVVIVGFSRTSTYSYLKLLFDDQVSSNLGDIFGVPMLRSFL